MKIKNYISFIVLIGVLAMSCSSSSNSVPVTPTNTTFTATLNGANETPANPSTATGTGNFTFNPVTKILSGTVTYSGLTVTSGHIHKGAVGVAGGVVFPFTSLSSPISFTSVALTQAQIDDLMNGLYYVNLHSDAYPNGEIRGQLVKSGTGTQTSTFNATINGASETPANASTATGTAVFTFNPTTNILSGTVTFSGLTATAAHIHNAVAGSPGPVVFPLGSAPFTSPISFTSPALTAAQVADLMANKYYVNIHSSAYPDGEIRGQLIKSTSTGTGTGTGTGGGGGY